MPIRCFYRSITILSRKEMSAIKLSFHHKTNLITGNNHVGKSSILKTILWTLGAEPFLAKSWKELDIFSKLTIAVGKNNYHVLRNGQRIALFTEQGRIIKRFTNISTDLTGYFSRLFNFRLHLVDRSNRLALPPPAFMLLPFYIDQDHGWHAIYESFNKLKQFKDYKKGCLEYYSGTRTNTYYSIMDEIAKAQNFHDKFSLQNEGLQSIDEVISKSIDKDLVNFNIDIFKDEINELLTKCNQIKDKEVNFTEKINGLNSARMMLQEQEGILLSVIKNLEADYNYANEDAKSKSNIECPMCGSIHNNNLAVRFNIAQDIEMCKDLLISVQKEKTTINDNIDENYNILESTKKESEELVSILKKRKNNYELQDIINNNSGKQLSKIITNQKEIVINSLYYYKEQIKKWKKRLKIYLKKNKTNETNVNKMFKEIGEELFNTLAVDADYIRKSKNLLINFAISDAQGSYLPRAHFAYFMTILNLMNRYSSMPKMPIIIDSPFQNDQDIGHYHDMLTFIVNKKPKQHQLILGAVDSLGFTFDNTIHLSSIRRALNPNEYSEINKVMSPFLSQFFKGVND